MCISPLEKFSDLKIEIKNLATKARIGISEKERKKFQPLLVTLQFSYAIKKNDQLKNEIENKNWIVGKNKTGNILSIYNQKHWKNEMKKLGGEYLLWSESPENPISN